MRRDDGSLIHTRGGGGTGRGAPEVLCASISLPLEELLWRVGVERSNLKVREILVIEGAEIKRSAVSAHMINGGKISPSLSFKINSSHPFTLHCLD